MSRPSRRGRGANEGAGTPSTTSLESAVTERTTRLGCSSDPGDLRGLGFWCGRDPRFERLDDRPEERPPKGDRGDEPTAALAAFGAGWLNVRVNERLSDSGPSTRALSLELSSQRNTAPDRLGARHATTSSVVGRPIAILTRTLPNSIFASQISWQPSTTSCELSNVDNVHVPIGRHFQRQCSSGGTELVGFKDCQGCIHTKAGTTSPVREPSR
jgi:hypothetical protein